MEFKKPKSKKSSALVGKLKLPLKTKKEITGIFNGEFVTVRGLDSMNYVYRAGNFGKGNLSKGEPSHSVRNDDIPKVVLQHQFENQKKWVTVTSNFQSDLAISSWNNELHLSLESINNLLQSSSDVNADSWKSWKENHKQTSPGLNLKKDSNKTDLPMTESKSEQDYKDEYFISMVEDILKIKELRKPKISYPNGDVLIVQASSNTLTDDFSPSDINARLDTLPYQTVENLNLNLEESFFLKSAFGCLNIVDMNLSEMDIPLLWQKFNSAKKNFTERYITYHYYRTKGWVVRSGLKFGGDFLLYKNGPAHDHASYLVKTLGKRKKLTWREFLATNRLVETFNKDLLLSNVKSTGTSEEKQFNGTLSNCAIQEILVKRWFPSKERFSKEDKIFC